MSDLNLENIVGFKAVDKDGNEQNVTVDEMVDMVSTRMVMALSETSTFAAAAATGNDVYENELPTVTDAANVRVLQSSGDAAKMTMQSLASKLGGLLQVSSVGEIDLKPNINVSMKLREGIYAFYDNYAISGFILTVADNIYTNRSKIIAGEKSASLSIEFGSNGVTFQSNAARKLHYRLLAYYK
ncbi:hypothetical protein [Phocaeicola vulgatus]|uniref:hypothetical protein n=1 Tax=Phocaeicola vulgatus TaxID=821 RepID=UPI001E2DBFE8|nr:hypothetical protein [Phocaeicola vulgatus]